MRCETIVYAEVDECVGSRAIGCACVVRKNYVRVGSYGG